MIGHRGAAAVAPENTLAGIRAAHAAGARWVEFDVRLSRDGVLYLLHDATLERTTNGRGLAAHIGFGMLEMLDAGSWFSASFAQERIPTLAQVFTLLSELQMGANIEIKPDYGREAETGEAVARFTARNWPGELPRPILSSFKMPALAAAHRTEPELSLGLLVETMPIKWRKRMKAFGCSTLHAHYAAIGRKLLDKAKRKDIPVIAFTVNKGKRAVRLHKAGVSAIITDDPKTVISAINSAEADRPADPEP